MTNMIYFSIKDKIDTVATYYIGKFFRNGEEIFDAPKWAMSLRAAQSMRFRYDEINDNRDKFFADFFTGKQKSVVPVELIHSKTVYAVNSAADIGNRKGDGVITDRKNLVPAVTVADCMPIFIYDAKTGVFGSIHSGWRGTGIVGEALRLAKSKYGANVEDFSVVLGPHIQSCCYNVNEERAAYFRKNFTEECVNGASLSLAKANLAVLNKAGVKSENIAVCTDCTCCARNASEGYPFGSFRRETNATVGLPFTVQAAFCYWE